MEKQQQSAPAVRGQGILEWYEALISAALVLVLVFSFFWRTCRFFFVLSAA